MRCEQAGQAADGTAACSRATLRAHGFVIDFFTERVRTVHNRARGGAGGCRSPPAPGGRPPVEPNERSPPPMRSRLAGACVVTASVAVLVPASASARPIVAHAAAKPKITMSGSTSVAPLASKLIKAYLKKYPNRASFTLAQGGSDVGVADIAAGRVSIGNSSRDAKPTDPGGLHWYKIARDAICLATNKNNTISNLSQPQVQDIFSGKIRDWGDVPGATATGPISLVVRTAA